MDSSGSLPEANVSFSRDDDFVVISKPKTGVAFVEARVKDDFQAASTEKGFQQIQARLERALNDPELEGTVISLGSDLLKDPALIGRFPHGMFDTVYVVEFQGMSPGVKFVQAKNVDLRVHVYRFASHDLAPLDCPSESMLPSTQLDGLWELC